MAERLNRMGDTISTGDPSLEGRDLDIAELCQAAADAFGKVAAAYSMISIGRIGGSATETALFNALAAEAAHHLALGAVATCTDPEAALEQGCEALRANFRNKLPALQREHADFLADEARGATKQ